MLMTLTQSSLFDRMISSLNALNHVIVFRTVMMIAFSSARLLVYFLFPRGNGAYIERRLSSKLSCKYVINPTYVENSIVSVKNMNVKRKIHMCTHIYTR